ncbi:MAG: hypothetical protein AAF696_14285, partial [Bacteroidota bacterium]
MRKFFIIVIAILLLGLLIWPAKYQGPDLEAPQLHIMEPDIYEDICLKIIRDTLLHTEGWDQLVQPAFWRTAMKLGPDSLIVNIAKSREMITRLKTSEWRSLTERAQKVYEDSIRKAHDLKARDEIYFTTGRNHFYKYEELLPHIDQAVEAFMEEFTDPWYAQSILL